MAPWYISCMDNDGRREIDPAGTWNAFKNTVRVVTSFILHDHCTSMSHGWYVMLHLIWTSIDASYQIPLTCWSRLVKNGHAFHPIYHRKLNPKFWHSILTPFSRIHIREWSFLAKSAREISFSFLFDDIPAQNLWSIAAGHIGYAGEMDICSCFALVELEKGKKSYSAVDVVIVAIINTRAAMVVWASEHQLSARLNHKFHGERTCIRKTETSVTFDAEIE